jgi:hypothetical protein
MTTTTPTRTPETPSVRRTRMDPLRRTALIVGVLFVITYVTSIAAKFGFYPPLADNPDYIVSGGEETRVLWGAFLEVLLIVANIGTAVALYPVVRRRFPAMSLGFVTARVMESVFIAVGVLAVLSIVTMRQDFAGTEGAALAPVGQALTALWEWTFILGPGFVVGIGNGMLLGYMMWRSRLVPRGLAALGLVGGPLICLAGAGMVMGVIEEGSGVQMLTAMPEFFWELGFGVYLIVKGFKPSPVTAELS